VLGGTALSAIAVTVVIRRPVVGLRPSLRPAEWGVAVSYLRGFTRSR
jgi:hypothetical protein